MAEPGKSHPDSATGEYEVDPREVQDAISAFQFLESVELSEVTAVTITEKAEATLANGGKVSSTVEKKRFEKVSDQELDRIREDRCVCKFVSAKRRYQCVRKCFGFCSCSRIPTNTKRNTDMWLGVFNSWLKETGRKCDLRTVSAKELASNLEHAYAEIRKQDRCSYSKSSLQCFRSSIHRMLSKYNRQINIFKDKEFQRANEVLDGVIVKSTRDGSTKPTAHKPAMTEEDFEKLQEYFAASFDSDPLVLREYVWFIVTFHFCLRSSEVQSQLRKEDLVFCTDQQGKQYICLRKDYVSKNHQGGLRQSSPETDGRIVNQEHVEAVALLLSKLDPTCDRVFQMPLKNRKADGPWYCAKPVGKNKLAEVMKSLSTKAALSCIYTNHCVRATCITRMTNKKVPDHVIARTSGHKSLQSLQAYHNPSEKQKLATASLIDVTPPPAEKMSPAAVLPPPSLPDSMEIDSLLTSLSGEQISALETGDAALQPYVPPTTITGNFQGANLQGATINFILQK